MINVLDPWSPAPPEDELDGAATLAALAEQIDQLTSLVEDIHARDAEKPQIDPKARYRLSAAADYLETSTSTLKRRARRKKFVVVYDGKTPFVMGAEILRYAREGAGRKAKRSRSRKAS